MSHLLQHHLKGKCLNESPSEKEGKFSSESWSSISAM